MRVFVSILIRLQLVGVLVTIYFLVWMLCIDGVCVCACMESLIYIFTVVLECHLQVKMRISETVWQSFY